MFGSHLNLKMPLRKIYLLYEWENVPAYYLAVKDTEEEN